MSGGWYKTRGLLEWTQGKSDTFELPSGVGVSGDVIFAKVGGKMQAVAMRGRNGTVMVSCPAVSSIAQDLVSSYRLVTVHGIPLTAQAKLEGLRAKHRSLMDVYTYERRSFRSKVASYHLSVAIDEFNHYVDCTGFDLVALTEFVHDDIDLTFALLDARCEGLDGAFKVKRGTRISEMRSNWRPLIGSSRPRRHGHWFSATKEVALMASLTGDVERTVPVSDLGHLKDALVFIGKDRHLLEVPS